MPELHETIASLLFLLSFFRWCLEKQVNLTLLGLWADATNKPTEGKLASGHVYKLEATSTIKRGSNHNQSWLYPHMWQQNKANPNPPPLTQLVLTSVSNTNRAIILDFGQLVFQLAYLTHTSIQIFTREIWENTVVPSLKDKRGYCIGLAFEFKEYFIAFLTLDQVFQPEWAHKLQDLPPSPPDVYSTYSDFLSTVSNWIRQRAEKANRFGLACEAIRMKGSKVWAGVGVYTVCELFFDAGISPFLTEAEVFDCPSRTARLCEAMWSYAYKSYKELPTLMHPAIYDGILAPTKKQRLKYKRWLHVYGKARSRLSLRQVTLWENYQKTLQDIESNCDVQYFRKDTLLIDVFEPNHLKYAFEKKELVLGSLIFGENKWLQFGYLMPSAPDPLTLMFRDRGLCSSPTHLTDYDQLYTNWSDVKNRSPPWRTTFSYRIPGSKQIWSITRSFPENFTFESDIANKPVIHIEGQKRTEMLFETIVSKTNRVAIGPLEYCGNGTIIRTTHSKPLVHAVRATWKEIIQYNASKTPITITQNQNNSSSDSDLDSNFELVTSTTQNHTLLSESNAYICPDDYTSTGSIFDSNISTESDSKDLTKRSQSRSSLASSFFRSRATSVSSDHMPQSDISFHSQESDADSDIDNNIVQRKKKATYLTADREILLNAAVPTNIEEDHVASMSSNAPQASNRLKHSNTTIFYGRNKRQYNRKK